MNEKSTNFRKKMFSEEQMFRFIEKKAEDYHLYETAKALDYVSKCKDAAPYTACFHAMALGIEEDGVLAALVLHDLTGIYPENTALLPVSTETKKLINTLRFEIFKDNGETKKDARKRYYSELEKNPKASLIKCIERCYELSEISLTSRISGIPALVRDTEKYVLPLLKTVREQMPRYRDAVWLLEYQMLALLETMKRAY